VIQLAATDDEATANAILQRAKAQGRSVLAKASPFTEKIVPRRRALVPGPLLGLWRLRMRSRPARR
jgi:hypothetical protein